MADYKNHYNYLNLTSIFFTIILTPFSHKLKKLPFENEVKYNL